MGPTEGVTLLHRRTSKSPLRARGSIVVLPSKSPVYYRSDSENSELMALASKMNNNRKSSNSTMRPPKTAPRPQSKGKLVRQESIPRPQTATLERPRVLDACYLKKLDMSLTRKALLSITHLCKVQAVKRGKQPMRASGRAVTMARLQPKKPSEDESWEDESYSEIEKPLKFKRTPRAIIKKPVTRDIKTTPTTQGVKNRKATPVPQKKEVKVTPKSPRIIPEPCRSCGRADLPERLHSHPKRPSENTRAAVKPVPVVTVTAPANKNSVQRPFPIKFRSEKSKSKGLKPTSIKENTIKELNSNKSPRASNSKPAVDKNSSKEVKSPARSPTSPRSFVVVGEPRKSPNPAGAATNPSSSTSPASGPRLLKCSMCGREFGTASLALHEKRCLEAQLVPCDSCGRTFLPDRLTVHRKSCNSKTNKAPAPATDSTLHLVSAEDHNNPNRAISPRALTSVCYICGRNFGTRSIVIHEPQCLRKWRAENDQLPPEQRRPEPRRGGAVAEILSPHPESLTRAVTPLTSPRRSPQPALAICYICGRNFGTMSLPIHEPQCLRKWRNENDKLPQEKKRPEPKKPEIQLTDDGSLDPEATFHAIWQSHLDQLVPCKACGRTFFPDRLEVHSRSCKEGGGRR